MTNSENTLLIWVLSIAGFFLAVLYSPLGSPDLYHQRKYFTEDQGVNFNSAPIAHGSKQVSSLQSKLNSLKGTLGSLGSVKNSPKSRTYSSIEGSELNVPDEASKNQKHYKSSRVNDSNAQNKSAVSVKMNKSTMSIANSASSNTNNSNSATNTAASNGGNTESATLNSTRSTNNTSQNNDVKNINVNLSPIDSTSLLASNFSAQKAGGFVDPGTGDPLGDPLPIPEGWSCFALFIVAYCTFIFFRKRQSIQPIQQ